MIDALQVLGTVALLAVLGPPYLAILAIAAARDWCMKRRCDRILRQ